MTRHPRLRPVLLIILMILVPACAIPPPPVCEKNGKPYCRIRERFTGKWYSYYKRALSCMEGGCYMEAVSDLSEAADRHPDDKRWASTYGMHYMDYFPHREMGIAHYFLGDDQLAKSELELSIAHEPSAKAHFYLNKVRSRMLRQEGRASGNPRLTIRTPSGQAHERWTKDDPAIISGIATDEHYVSEIILNRKPLLIERVKKDVAFEETFRLDEGRHEIPIIARNLLRGETRQKLILHVDRSGPIITIRRITPTLVKVGLWDASGVTALWADGCPQSVTKGQDVSFEIPLRAGMKTTLTAEDRLGNQTRAALFPEMLSKAGSCLLAMRTDSAQYVPDVSPLISSASEEEGIRIILDIPGNPWIVFSESISLRGRIYSSHDIGSVWINERPLPHKIAHLIFFSQSVRLEKGANRITIRARDAAGKDVEKHAIIVRETPEVFKLKYRCMLNAHPFEIYAADEAGKNAEGLLCQYHFLEGLVSGNRFQISLKNPLRKMLAQYGFDEVRAGHLLPNEIDVSPTRLSLSGYVHVTRLGFEAVAKVTDVSSTEILNTAYIDAYGESRGNALPKSLGNALSEKIHKAFPLVRGKVSREDGGKYLISTGNGDIRMQWPLIVGSDTEFIGHARIDEKLGHGRYWIRLLKSDKQNILGAWMVTK